MERYLESSVKEDLKEKMVFVGGPRQVGKTTLAFHLLNSKDESHLTAIQIAEKLISS